MSFSQKDHRSKDTVLVAQISNLESLGTGQDRILVYGLSWHLLKLSTHEYQAYQKLSCIWFTLVLKYKISIYIV